MILETIALIAVGVTGLGAGFLIATKSKVFNNGSPRVKVIKVAFTMSGDVFINMIEYEDKRTISYSFNPRFFDNEDAVETKLKHTSVGVYNHLQLWLNFDVNEYPDLSNVHGMYYV